MTCTTPYAPATPAATTLRDFAIQGAAELGECCGSRSFRAVRKRDGHPVLLHKFRPATRLTTLGPLVRDRESPDFGRPFITQFSDLFAVAGSAYLVEPLPVCSGLSDVWRHVLQKRPEQAITVMTVLIRQMISITRQLLRQGRGHGAVDAQNIILAPTGCFGLLASYVECEGGIQWLRKSDETPSQPDCHALVDVLGVLLDLDAEVAAAKNAPMRVSLGIHRRIRSLSYALEQARRGHHRPVCS
ncbi:MAG: hypothetical protein ABFE01_04365 [Phycisphaerales bacterium]